MHRALVLTFTLLSVAAAAPAGAATISEAPGGGLTFQAEPGERNQVTLAAIAGGAPRINISDQNEITSFPDSCSSPNIGQVVCPVPPSLRVELGDGADVFGTYKVGFAHQLVVVGGDGDDTMTGDDTALDKTFDGGAGVDDLKGFAGNDVLRGGPGDDILTGDLGNDQLHGDDGNDLLRPDNAKAPGNDLVDGGPGVDTIDDYVQSSASNVFPPVNLSLNGLADDGRPGETDNLMNVERSNMYVSGKFDLSDGPDHWTIFANTDGGNSTVLARGGDDRIVGEDHDETIDGGAGNDYLEGGRRNDTITGGPGADTILGDEADTGCTWAPEYCLVFGNDVIDARDGEVDKIDCGPGQDRLTADPVDVHSSCETVTGQDSGKGGGPTPGGGSGGPAVMRLSAVKTSLARALRSGLRVKVTGAPAGTLKLIARRSGTVVAKGSAALDSSGTGTVKLRFTSRARRQLRRARTLRLTVSATGADALKVLLKR